MHYKPFETYSMKKLLYLLFAMSVATGLNACSPNDDPTNDSSTETPKTPGQDRVDMIMAIEENQ